MSPPAAGAAAAAAPGRAAPAITPLTKPCTSSCVMRPLGPLPFTSSRGTPSSRAKRRTDGDACGNCPFGAAGSCGGNAAVGDVRGAAAAVAAPATGEGDGAGAVAGAEAAAPAPAAAWISATGE